MRNVKSNRAKLLPPKDGCRFISNHFSWSFLDFLKEFNRCVSNHETDSSITTYYSSFAAQLLPPHLYQEALSCHAAGNEILRHFWASTSMDKAAKHLRMIESLKKIRDENVKSLMIQASSLGTDCLDAMKMVGVNCRCAFWNMTGVKCK